MKRNSLPMSEVSQLNSRVNTLDSGQQEISPAATMTPSSDHPKVADQRSRLTDQPGRPGILSKTKPVVTGSGQLPEAKHSPQDEDWNETFTTASHFSTSPTQSPRTKPNTLSSTLHQTYHRHASSLLAASISVTSFLSPIVMVCLPLSTNHNLQAPCDTDCERLLVALSVKLLILLAGTWALFARRPRASLPRLSVFRSLVLFAAALLTLSYWLFFGVRILRPGFKDFGVIVGFASSLVDALLFVHYLAVVLLRIRPVIAGQFVVKIVRSPDGESRSYSVGAMSIQSLAVCCLQHYYRDFPVYSPHLDRIRGGPETQRAPGKSASATEYKLYSIDEVPSPLDLASPDAEESRSPASGPGASSPGCLARRRRDDEEQRREWLRKLERRRSRLVEATEEAFYRVAKANGTEEGNPAGQATVQEASAAVFDCLCRPLYRYLRLVRQPPPYSKQEILDHISVCIVHELSARSFLECYLQPAPVGLAPKGRGGLESENNGDDEWTLVSDKLLNAAAENCTSFEICRDQVRLLVVVREIPHVCLTQDVSKSFGFVLEPGGQTTRERML